jgi:hypothetical protein
MSASTTSIVFQLTRGDSKTTLRITYEVVVVQQTTQNTITEEETAIFVPPSIKNLPYVTFCPKYLTRYINILIAVSSQNSIRAYEQKLKKQGLRNPYISTFFTTRDILSHWKTSWDSALTDFVSASMRDNLIVLFRLLGISLTRRKAFVGIQPTYCFFQPKWCDYDEEVALQTVPTSEVECSFDSLPTSVKESLFALVGILPKDLYSPRVARVRTSVQ